MKRLLTLVLAAMAFAACTQNDVEELSANRADAPETLTVGFEGGDTRIELNEAVKTVWTEGDEVSVFYRSYENTHWAFQGETGDRSGELILVSGEVGAQTMDNSIIVYPYSDSYAINADTHAVAAPLPAVQSYKEGSYGKEGNIMVAESKFTQFTLKSIVGWLRFELTGNRHIVNSITLRGNDGEQVAGLCYINAADASIALAESDVDESLVATEVRVDCGDGVTLGAEATEFYIALLPQTFDKGLTVEVDYANAEPQTLVYENAITIRRNHISPINSETQGEAIIRTDKLFYTATALVEPYDTSAFNVAIVSNEWNEATGEGVITFDGELTTIGEAAFLWCESLTSVTIPDSVTTIGDRAFYECCLTSVTIPNSVTTIGEAAFGGCSSLAEFKGKFAADGGRCLVKDNTIIAYAEASGTTYTIPDSVTTIGDCAFERCSSLTSVTIPDSVTTIRDWAFCECYSLTSVTIGDSVTTIGWAAFYWCESLTSVTIPDSLTTIGNSAFCDCDSLTSVYCKATTPPTLGGEVLWGYDNNWNYVMLDCDIYVPAESVGAYKAAENWSEYADYIVGYDFETGEEDAFPDDVVMNVVGISAKMRTGGKVWDLTLTEKDAALGEPLTQITVEMGSANMKYITSGTYSTLNSNGILPGTVNTDSGEWSNSVYRYNTSRSGAIEDCELTIAVDEATQTAAISGYLVSKQIDDETGRTFDVNVIFEWNGHVEGFRWEDPTDGITDWKTFSISAEFDDCKCIKGVSNGGNEVAIYLHTLGATKADALAAGTYPVADWVYTTTSNYCESESTKVNGYEITSGSVTVEGGDNNYTVRFELSDGSNTYKGVYTGALY